MYPHRIRLRGPWEYEPLESSPAAGALPPAGRMTLPCRWRDGGLCDFAGRVRFRRRFGYPGRLDARERVWLTFAGVETVAEVWLNDHSVGRNERNEPFEFEVTPLLLARNELRVDVKGPGDGGLWGEVALEVRCAAWLRGVRVWTTAAAGGTRWHAAGEVAGTCERPLDLYLMVGRSTAAYTTAGDGQFELAGDVAAGEPEQGRAVCVELVQGGVVWYRWEQSGDSD
jgi:hypothetical protein